jgi:hypothetical protein
MLNTFGHPFVVEMHQFLDQVDVLEKDRATLPGRQGVLVVRDRNTLVCLLKVLAIFNLKTANGKTGGVSEISSIRAPECFLARFLDLGTEAFGICHF